ncbi:PDZ domain-containing protein [Caenorhabditis elegans]|uniref:PDZ domain-containing protein n=1 Tax=Caenorhabditis elegans TaxID=6239 RepID=O02063_CAEEL|nr:PDZ domain-containing protein [Caenorhabditis elegans]CCD67592.1 PDZ domain-containing protein [Caenorhabditis elegans]|eukprot:NP_491965.1 Sperm Meiosis PDZ domain containing proteins [Caenorhabditis elegans]
MGSEKMIEICIDMEEGEPLGATPNDKLVITKIQAGTISEGKLRIGDQVKKVNGQNCKDCNDFFRALRFAAPCAKITVNRDEKKAEELEARVHIPEDRAKIIQRREGYVYELATLVWVQNGPKLGLGIKHFQNRVLVSRVDPGSLAEKCLVLGDHLCDVDGIPVSDKDVARDLLVKNIQEKGKVTFVVERPDSIDAKQWAKQALATNLMQPPSVQMNEDVKGIASQYRQALPGLKPPAKSAMSTGPNARRVSIIEQTQTHEIGHDHEGKALRKVK